MAHLNQDAILTRLCYLRQTMELRPTCALRHAKPFDYTLFEKKNPSITQYQALGCNEPQ